MNIPTDPKERALFIAKIEAILAERAKKAKQEPSPAGDEYTPNVPIPEGEAGWRNFQPSDIISTLRNIPSSVGGVARQTGKMLSSPLETSQTMIQAGVGLPGAVIDRLLGITSPGQESPLSTSEAQGMVEGVTKAYSPSNIRKTVVENPAQTAMDVGSILSPALKLGGATRAASAVDRFTNPLALAGEGIGALRAKGFRPLEMGRRLGQHVLGITTGSEAEMFRRAFATGEKSPYLIPTATGTAGKEFRGALRGGTRPEAIAEQFRDSASLIKQEKEMEYLADLPKLALKDPALPLDLTAFQVDLFDMLKKNYGIKPKYNFQNGQWIYDGLDFSGKTPVKTSPAQMRTLNEMTSYLLEEVAKGDNSIGYVDNIKKALDNYIKSNVTENNKLANSVAVRTRKIVRKQLGERVEGYDDLMKNFEEAQRLENELEDVMSTGSKNPETLITKLTSILRDTPNVDIRKRLVETIEQKYGQPVNAQVAGLRGSALVPSGMFGRFTLGGIFGGGVFANPLILAGVPFTSPRATAELLHAMGRVKGTAGAAADVLSKYTKFIPPGTSTKGLTWGEIFEKYVPKNEEMEGKEESMGGEVLKTTPVSPKEVRDRLVPPR